MPTITKLLNQNDAGFKRYTGIHKANFEQTLKAMQEHEVSKTKSGRSSEFSLEAPILLALTYWGEYRTFYHIGIDFGVHESSTSPIFRKVENVLIQSRQACLDWLYYASWIRSAWLCLGALR